MSRVAWRLSLAGALACALALAFWIAWRSPEAPAPEPTAQAPILPAPAPLEEPSRQAAQVPFAHERCGEGASHRIYKPLSAFGGGQPCWVTVVVSTEDGTRLAKATVRMTMCNPEKAADASRSWLDPYGSSDERSTDEQGTAYYSLVSPGDYSLVVTHRTGAAVSRQEIVRRGITEIQVVIPAAAARIRGMVTTNTCSPARTAHLTVQRLPSGPPFVAVDCGKALIDERGGYATARLAAGTYAVVLVRSRDDCGLATKTVTLEGTDVWADFVVPEEGSISGRVTGPSGAAVQARVTIGPNPATGTPWKVHSARDTGAYAFGSLPAGAYSLLVCAPRQEAALRKCTIIGGQTIQVDVQLESGGRIFGAVRAASSTPTNGRVEVLDAPAGRSGIDRSSCDIEASGRFLFDSMAFGRYVLRVQPENLAWQTVEVVLSADAPEALVTVDAEEGGRLAGQVLQSGTVIDSVSVTFTVSPGLRHAVQAAVAPDGSFVVEHVPAGSVDVAVKGPGELSDAARLTFRNGEDTAWTFELAGRP